MTVKAPTDPVEAIGALIGKVKDHIDAKEWKKVEKLFDFPTIWTFDHPEPVQRLIEQTESLCATIAKDVEFSLSSILHSEIGDKQATFSFRANITWTEGEAWEEKKLPVDFHLGLDKQKDGSWKVSYLGVTKPGEVEKAPLPELPAAPYFEAAYAFDAPYFLGAEERHITKPTTKHHMVYAPIFLPEDVVRGILSGDK